MVLKIGCTVPLIAPETRDRMIDYRIILLHYHECKGFVCSTGNGIVPLFTTRNVAWVACSLSSDSLSTVVAKSSRRDIIYRIIAP